MTFTNIYTMVTDVYTMVTDVYTKVNNINVIHYILYTPEK